jgi:hypothetical protein
MHTQTIRHWFNLACKYKNQEDPRLYLVAAAISYTLVVACYWGPALGQNETVYLVQSRNLAADGFLGPNGGTPWLNLNFMFNILLSPLWWLTQEPIKLAMVARAIIWLPVVYSVARLARQLRVPPLFFICGFCVWLIKFKQNLGADEWIFGSIEQKVCAYGFAFAALTDLMCNRVRRAAVFAGAAVLFHIIIGGWVLMGLGIAVFADRRRFPFSQLVTFVLISGVVLTPMIIPALKYWPLTAPETKPPVETSLATDNFDADRMIVKFRNPHHLDPDRVLIRKVVSRTVFMIVALFGCFYITQRGRDATLLIVFTSFLMSLWIIAFIAGKAQWYWPLKFYLFRVGDTVLPLLFWLCVPAWAFNTLLRHDSSSLAQKMIALTVWTVAMCWVDLSFPREVKKKVFRNVKSWQQPADSELQATFSWIRQYTEENDVFLMNPCNLVLGFKLYTDRPIVVNFKSVPHNKQIVRWFEKLEATNGGESFQGRGFKVCKEINKNFPNLSVAHLRSIRERYRARYYFVDVERPLLKPMLVFQKGKWHIYDLAQIPSL